MQRLGEELDGIAEKSGIWSLERWRERERERWGRWKKRNSFFSSILRTALLGHEWINDCEILTWPTSKSKRRGTETRGRRRLARTVCRYLNDFVSPQGQVTITGNSSPISTVDDGCSSSVRSPARISFHQVTLRLGPTSQRGRGRGRGRGLKDERMPARWCTPRFNLSWTLFSGRTAKAEPSIVWPDRYST